MTDLLTLAGSLPSERVAAGGVLVEEGTRPSRLLFLESGSVTVERDGVPFARIDMPGAVFGELSWVLGQPATATVRATTDVVVRVATNPTAFLTENPGAALEVLRTTAARLDGLTRYLADVKQQFADRDDHLGMVDRILDVLVHHQTPAAAPGSVRDPDGH